MRLTTPDGDVFEAHIEFTEGKRKLKEYTTKYSDENSKAQRAECFAECEEGQAFAIVIKRTPFQARLSSKYGATVKINGAKIHSSHLKAQEETRRVRKAHLLRNGDAVEASLVSNPMQITEDSKVPTVLDPNMGTIQLTLRSRRASFYGFDYPRKSQDIKDEVEERFSMKRRLGTTVSTPPVKMSVPESIFRFRRDSKNGVTLTFQWMYRTELQLILLGVKQDPNPSPPIGKGSIRAGQQSSSSSRKRQRSATSVVDENTQMTQAELEELEDIKPGVLVQYEALQKRMRHMTVSSRLN